MDEYFKYLTQLKTQDFDVVNQLSNYINTQFQNSSFGNLLFEVLNSSNIYTFPHEVIDQCCNDLKNWTKNQWGNMTPEYKRFYFDSLKKLIISNHPAVLSLSNTFVAIAEIENFRELYEIHYDDFLNNLSPNFPQLLAFINIIEFASRKYIKKSSCEPNQAKYFFEEINNKITVPFLTNPQMTQIPEGCEVLQKVLSIFKHVFFYLKPPIEVANLTIQFAQQVQLAYVNHSIQNTNLVTKTCRYLNKFYNNSNYRKAFKNNGNIENMIQSFFHLLTVALSSEQRDQYFISAILMNIESYIKYVPVEQTLITLLLEASKLSSDDLANFVETPNIFYYDIYERTIKGSQTPSRIARSLLHTITFKNQQLVLTYLISLPPSENVVRCLSLCIRTIEKGAPLPEPFVAYYQGLILSNSQDPYFVAALLNLLCNLVPFLSSDRKMEMMNFVKHYIRSNNVIITMFACDLLGKLLKYDIYPFDGAVSALIDFIPHCFTSTVLKSLKRLIAINGESVLPYFEIVMCGIYEDFEVAFQQCNSDDPKQNEFGTDTVRSNLEFYAMLIKNVGCSVVQPNFVHILQNILDFEICDDEIVNPMSDLLSAIFQSKSQYIPTFMQILFAFLNDPNWLGFVCELVAPFMAMIDNSPEIFLNLNISTNLVNLCMCTLKNPNYENKDDCLEIGSLLSWILLIDCRIDVSEIIQSGLMVFSFVGSIDIRYLSAFIDIFLSISISRKMFPENNVILLIVEAYKKNWCLRIEQKLLYIIFFISLSLNKPEFAEDAMPIVFDLLTKLEIQCIETEKNGNGFFIEQSVPNELSTLTNEHKFRSPINNIQFVEMIMPALNLLQCNSVQNIARQFPAAFEKYAKK